MNELTDIANKFNEFFFINVGPNLASKMPPVPTHASLRDTMPSPYPFSVVKYVINDIAYPLCKIFNQSFLIGIFPDKLKHAKIPPIFKSDDKLLVNNYRPVSLLPVFF